MYIYSLIICLVIIIVVITSSFSYCDNDSSGKIIIYNNTNTIKGIKKRSRHKSSNKKVFGEQTSMSCRGDNKNVPHGTPLRVNLYCFIFIR